MTKGKVKKVTMGVLRVTVEAVGMAAISCAAAIIGGKIALAEFAKDGVNVKVNKVENAEVLEEV